MQKSLPYLAMVHNTPSTFTLVNKKEHAWKKRILSQSVSDSATRSYEPNILKLVDRFCDVLCPVSKPRPGESGDLEKSVIQQIACSVLCPQPPEKDRTESATPETKSTWSEPFNMATWC